MAPVVARRWQPMLFFVVVAVCSPHPFARRAALPYTPRSMRILPRFEGLHEHSPERVLIVFIPAIALLAAATVSFSRDGTGSSAVLLADSGPAPAVLTLALSVSPASQPDVLLSREVTILIVAVERAGCVFRADHKCAHSNWCADRTGLSDALGSGRPHRLRGFAEDPRWSSRSRTHSPQDSRLIPLREWSGVISRAATSQPARQICWL